MKSPWAPLQNRLVQLIAHGTEILNARSPREKTLAIFFGVALVVAADYWIWANPVIHGLIQITPQNHALQDKVAELREYQASKSRITNRYETLTAQLKESEKSLVDADQIPALLENLSNMAHASGVKITSLSPDESRASESGKRYKAVPIQISALAGTHELGRFLNQLETGKILIKVTNLSISSETSDGRQHQIEMSLNAFRSTSSGEAAHA